MFIQSSLLVKKNLKRERRHCPVCWLSPNCDEIDPSQKYFLPSLARWWPFFNEVAFFYMDCYSTQLSYMACAKEGFEPSTHSVKVKLG